MSIWCSGLKNYRDRNNGWPLTKQIHSKSLSMSSTVAVDEVHIIALVLQICNQASQTEIG